MDLKYRPFWPKNLAIWHGNLDKSNLAWKFRPIWPGNLGQSGLELWDNMAWKILVNLAWISGPIWLEIQDNLAWKSCQAGLEIQDNLV